MKKVLIASFFVGMMLMVPLTSATQKIDNLDVVKPASQNAQIEFYITESDYNLLTSYIDNNIPEEKKSDAYEILDYIMYPHEVYGYFVDMEKLGEKWSEHGFHSIDPELIDNAETLEILQTLLRNEWVFDVLGEFVNFITGIGPIKNRLGWFRSVLNNMYSFCKQAAFIILEVTVNTLEKLQALADVVNFIMSVPETLYLALEDLVNGNGPGFKYKIGGLIEEFFTVSIGILPYAVDTLKTIPRIVTFLGDIVRFIADMLTGTPWKNVIDVSGTLVKVGIPGEVTISCRGASNTHTQGQFFFTVSPNPDETSLPENEYFGIHDCTITVSKDGEVLKTSTKVLSYVFSDGKIWWPFVIIKSRSRNSGTVNYVMASFNVFLDFIRSLLPNISRTFFKLYA